MCSSWISATLGIPWTTWNINRVVNAYAWTVDIGNSPPKHYSRTPGTYPANLHSFNGLRDFLIYSAACELSIAFVSLSNYDRLIIVLRDLVVQTLQLAGSRLHAIMKNLGTFRVGNMVRWVFFASSCHCAPWTYSAPSGILKPNQHINHWKSSQWWHCSVHF